MMTGCSVIFDFESVEMFVEWFDSFDTQGNAPVDWFFLTRSFTAWKDELAHPWACFLVFRLA